MEQREIGASENGTASNNCKTNNVHEQSTEIIVTLTNNSILSPSAELTLSFPSTQNLTGEPAITRSSETRRQLFTGEAVEKTPGKNQTATTSREDANSRTPNTGKCQKKRKSNTVFYKSPRKRPNTRSSTNGGTSRPTISERGTNQPTNPNTSNGTPGDATENGEDVDEQQESSVRSTAQHLSIHLIPVPALRKRFQERNERFSEAELIGKMIEQVNLKKSEGKQKRPDFKKEDIPYSAQITSNDSQNSPFEEFNRVVYIQTVKRPDNVLAQFGIVKESALHNSIIFYYRRNEIYALTTRQTWQAIQIYCCYQFPCKISSRLTSEEGNFSENAYHLTGNVRTSNIINRNPARLDKLKTVMLNVIKPLRPNSSLYRLKEFQSSWSGKGAKNQIKMQVGLAYVRIKRRMDPKNIPEILDHFSKILSGATFTYPGGKEETDIDDFPYILCVSSEESRMLNTSLCRLIRGFMHHHNSDWMRTFELIGKHFEDYCMAEKFELIYGVKSVEKIAEYTSPPTVFQVFYDIREKYGTDLEGKKDPSLKTFMTRLQNIKLSYTVPGSGKPNEVEILKLLDGEMSQDDKQYWKIMGQWFYLRDDYHYELHKEFLDLLGKEDMLLDSSGQESLLPKPWNRVNIKTVREYVHLYTSQGAENGGNMRYFQPPSADQLRQAMQVEEMEEDSEGIKPDDYFDMIGVRSEGNGKHSIYLFYLLDRFDAEIRHISTRIKKSIEVLVKNSPPTTPNRSNASNSIMSAAKLFWKGNREFRQIFSKSFAKFHAVLTSRNVHIIVACPTGRQTPVQYSPGTIMQFGEHTIGVDDGIRATLQREKNLHRYFSLESLAEVLAEVPNEQLQQMHEELNLVGPRNIEILKGSLQDKLVENGFCFINSNDDVGSSQQSQPENAAENESKAFVSGKFLKLRNSKTFRLFQNAVVNEELFKVLKRFYLTGFPGFINKLECLEIYATVSQEFRLKLSFADIP